MSSSGQRVLHVYCTVYSMYVACARSVDRQAPNSGTAYTTMMRCIQAAAPTNN